MCIRDSHENSYNVTAGNKFFRFVFGGVTLVSLIRAAVGGHDNFTSRFRNVGSAARNSFTTTSESVGATALSHIVSTIDTAATQTFSLVVNTAVATDYAVVESTCLDLIPGY